MSESVSRDRSDRLCSALPLRSLRLGGEFYDVGGFIAETPRAQSWRRDSSDTLVSGLKRRWLRERRRRKVGRAYDMALEIARIIPRGSDVLDVGCGNGFIAHHLSAILATNVLGIDLANSAEAPIEYRRFDGTRFPLPNDSVDAVLLCYVLHHAQDVSAVLSEASRVLRANGLAVIYEDIPQTRWDRFMCWFHNQQWHTRTGPCTFRKEREWQELFNHLGLEIVRERRLSRWRNLTHAVSRRLYVLKTDPAESQRWPLAAAVHCPLLKPSGKGVLY